MAKTDLTNQRQVFVEEYVRSGDHLEAAKKAGYKDTHTLRNQACKLRRECADEITNELHRNFAEIVPSALNILSDLAENAESLSVRLGATRDLHDIGLDFARTLKDWHHKLLENKEPLVKDGYDDRFMNMWRYYFSYCEVGFLARTISTVQFVINKPAFSNSISR
jgi:hypothetical protein